ncbi:stealth conserved region 3 domain-containing protein [Microbacterium mangrovi]|uniref:stealth conserved region 3 domain-containing protein n=1 Tax=Microbacterium mangrovi TaxID=1348253 RepID=UPI00068C0CDD|nr:stealth conserved region 3 domain-containing protein [Microbacterium mangrovi]
MKVTYVLTTADAAGGTERTIISQANWMADHAEVTILSLHKAASASHFAVDPRVKVKYATKRRDETLRPSLLIPRIWDDQFDAGSDSAVEDAFRRVSADIVVTTTPALALLASRFVPPRARIVHQEHRFSAARGPGFDPLRACAHRLDAIVVLTARNADWIRTELGEDAPRIGVVANGVDVASFAQSSLRQPLVMSAGRFVPAKQFDHLVRAFAVATEQHPEWRLRIYGDGPAKPRILTEIRRNGLETRVELPGAVSDIDSQLAKASIFALSSRSEALPMTLLEAQAAGVPVVSYDTATGPREILDATRGGIIVPMNSRMGLASGLRTLMADEERRLEFGRRAREAAWQFDSDNVMPAWLTIFGELLASEKRPSASAPREAVEPINDAAPAVDGESLRMAVIARLEAEGVKWRPATPRESAWRIAAAHEDVASVLRAIHAVDLPIQVSARWNNELLATPWTPTTLAPVVAPSATALTLDDASGRLLGSIQLWPTVDGQRISPDGRDGPASVDDSRWQRWMEDGTATPSGLPYWNTISFPIDVVYTWVDGSDPAWRARRAPFLVDGSVDVAHDSAREERYVSRDELYYSIRSVRRYLPWVRNIFVVTDRQTPSRVLNEFPDVQVVDHTEIFPDFDSLPVFNSHAIEASLHRIGGLAEHFIYFNDDFIVARPLRPDSFFFSNGVAKFFPTGVPLQYGGTDHAPHLAAASNNRALIAESFGFEITHSLLHAPYAHRRSSLMEIEDRFPEQLRATRGARFRSGTDLSVMSSFSQYFGYARGTYVPGHIGYRYASLRADTLVSRLQHILDDPKVDVVAVAEPMQSDRRHRDEHEILVSFLEELVTRHR